MVLELLREVISDKVEGHDSWYVGLDMWTLKITDALYSSVIWKNLHKYIP